MWYLTSVYGPFVEPARTEFFSWFKDIPIQGQDNWIILGDFNFYRSLEDINLPGGNIQETFCFNEAIGHMGLTELPIKGRAFTWSNMQQDLLLEKLDWFFTSVDTS